MASLQYLLGYLLFLLLLLEEVFIAKLCQSCASRPGHVYALLVSLGTEGNQVIWRGRRVPFSSQLIFLFVFSLFVFFSSFFLVFRW